MESWIMRWAAPKRYNHSCACLAVSSASLIFCHFPPPPPPPFLRLLLLLLEHRFISLLWEYLGMCRQVCDGAADAEAAYWELWWPAMCSPLLSHTLYTKRVYVSAYPCKVNSRLYNKGVSVCFHVGAAPSLKTSAFFFSSIFNVNVDPQVKTAKTI